jgi:hypothetical protein
LDRCTIFNERYHCLHSNKTIYITNTIMPLLNLSPDKIEFGTNILPNRTYQEKLTVTNTLSSPVTFGLRCSAPARLSVSPAQCTIEAGASETIYVKLNLSQVTIGSKSPKVFRDTLFIQSTYFQQKVTHTHSIHLSFTHLSPCFPSISLINLSKFSLFDIIILYLLYITF